jgi:hypothetical protein
MADPGALTGSSIAIGQTVYAYSFFLPKLSDVRKAGPEDSEMRGDVLLGQLAAGGVSSLVGIMLTWMSGSKVPMIVTIAIALFIAALYQYALNGNRVME